jgi:hypothetical protein
LAPGAAVGRGWIVVFVFVTVLVTALLPDRTVVHTTANTMSSTTYEITLLLAVVATSTGRAHRSAPRWDADGLSINARPAAR